MFQKLYLKYIKRLIRNIYCTPKSHQNAWPFMEPVKKNEAPGYYQVIRFPMGTQRSLIHNTP